MQWFWVQLAGVWHYYLQDVYVDDGPNEVNMEHEVVKYGMCIVNEMNVGKGENKLFKKEVGELKLHASINKDKEATEVKKRKERKIHGLL